MPGINSYGTERQVRASRLRGQREVSFNLERSPSLGMWKSPSVLQKVHIILCVPPPPPTTISPFGLWDGTPVLGTMGDIFLGIIESDVSSCTAVYIAVQHY